MAGVIITADDLDASASNVASLKTQMENTFEQTRSMIRSMNAYWESPLPVLQLPSLNSSHRFFPSISPL